MSSNVSDVLFRSLIGSPGTDSALSFTDTSAILGGGTPTALSKGVVYRLCATQDCHIKTSSSNNPTATTSTFILPAKTVERLSFNYDWYIAAIRMDTNGTLIITPMTACGVLP